MGRRGVLPKPWFAVTGLIGLIGLLVPCIASAQAAPRLARLTGPFPDQLLFIAGAPFGPGLGNGGPAVLALLSDPQGVAVDKYGDVFIADADDNEIREVTPNGLIHDFAGTGFPGYEGDGGSPGEAQLNHPEGVAVDPSGNLFIADTGNNVVREVSGGVISTYAGNGKAGYSGNGDAPTKAELNAPSGVAVTSKDLVAIADTGNSAVRVAAHVRIGSGPRSSTKGHIVPIYRLVMETVAGNGHAGPNLGDGGPAVHAILDFPTDITWDSTGDLYIADTGNSAVREISATSGDISSVVHVPYPTSVAVNPAGNLVIADPTDNRVYAYNVSKGTLGPIAGNGIVGDRGTGGYAILAEIDSPTGVAVDSYGDVFFSDTGNNAVRLVVAARKPVFLADSPPVVVAAKGHYSYGFRAFGVTLPTFSLVGAPSWLSISEATGAVSGTLPANVSSFSYSVDAKNPTGVTTAGPFTVDVPRVPTYLQTSEHGAVRSPVGVGLDSAGDVYVADAALNRLEVLRPNLTVLHLISTLSGGTTFNYPCGVAVLGSDVYVADTAHSRVVEYVATTGAVVRIFGSGVLDEPRGLAVTASGYVYVADTDHDRVVVFAPNGTLIVKFGTSGAGHGQMSSPTSVALSPLGRVLVADFGNHRIEEFSAAGAYIASFYGNALGFRALVAPYGVAVDSSGDIFVTDSHNDDVTEMSSTGAPAMQFGVPGILSGRLNNPEGVEVLSNGTIVIANTGNRRIDEFHALPTETFRGHGQVRPQILRKA